MKWNIFEHFSVQLGQQGLLAPMDRLVQVAEMEDRGSRVNLEKPGRQGHEGLQEMQGQVVRPESPENRETQDAMEMWVE